MFSQACAKNSVHRVGGCLPLGLRGCLPLGPGGCLPMGPGGYTPPGRQPQVNNPLGRHPPNQTISLGRHPPPRDGHCSGRYASYWNVFLLKICSVIVRVEPVQLQPKLQILRKIRVATHHGKIKIIKFSPGRGTVRKFWKTSVKFGHLNHIREFCHDSLILLAIFFETQIFLISIRMPYIFSISLQNVLLIISYGIICALWSTLNALK